MRFDVNSGKLEIYDGEMVRNYKYCHSFDTFEAALKEWEINRDYTFNEIIMITDSGMFDVTPTPTK